MRRRVLALLLGALGARASLAQEPAHEPAQQAAAWSTREEMVPMRDGVKLFTVIVSPANMAEPLPIIMTRTPYGAGGMMQGGIPPWKRELAADGYIFVEQDIRGRNKSEGSFEMNRPNRPAGATTGTDESTDTYDAIEWLIHNVPNNNGKVGIFGVSYPGWLAEEPLIGPHPALKAVSPQAPMTDTWMGDDFFHQGAFRQSYGFEYGWGMEADMVHAGPMPIDRYDAYDWYRSFPSLKALTDATQAMRIPTWRRFVEHPAYDSVWQSRAFQHRLDHPTVPTLVVGGFWDQEDLFGPQATYHALEQHDSTSMNFIVLGPWSHGQWSNPGGDRLGNIPFGQATSDTFRLRIQAPFFAYYLKGRGDGRFPEARLFDAGLMQWRSLDSWPARNAARRSLYFHADGVLSFDAPTAAGTAYDQYVSDPAHPVPYRPRPVERTYSRGSRWARWMTEDQRFVESRGDVLTWQTAKLDDDVTIAGDVVARLFASTSGTDADWVVKLIDVYPDTVTEHPELGGYQLMVAGDIMRGRYRRSWEHPTAIRPGVVDSYTVDLHDQLYTFRRGHRIMVQVQSSWFPLYDRNPQSFVPNIFLAPASSYHDALQRVWRSASRASRVDVLVLPR